MQYSHANSRSLSHTLPLLKDISQHWNLTQKEGCCPGGPAWRLCHLRFSMPEVKLRRLRRLVLSCSTYRESSKKSEAFVFYVDQNGIERRVRSGQPGRSNSRTVILIFGISLRKIQKKKRGVGGEGQREKMLDEYALLFSASHKTRVRSGKGVSRPLYSRRRSLTLSWITSGRTVPTKMEVSECSRRPLFSCMMTQLYQSVHTQREQEKELHSSPSHSYAYDFQCFHLLPVLSQPQPLVSSWREQGRSLSIPIQLLMVSIFGYLGGKLWRVPCSQDARNCGQENDTNSTEEAT